MNFQRRRPVDEPEINLISMVDLVLVMLLFFMVSTTFSKPGILRLNLPLAGHSTNAPDQADIMIDLDAAGQLAVNGQPATASSLGADLAALARNDPNRAIYLRAEGSSTQQQIVAVLDAARQAGLSRVSIGTLKAP